MRNETGSNPTLRNCTFCGNMATVGAGMRNNAGSEPELTNCTFAGNCAQVTGGGMYTTEGSPSVKESVFCKNWPNHIGGSWLDGGGNFFSPQCAIADANNDGFIDTLDLLEVIASWGSCP